MRRVVNIHEVDDVRLDSVDSPELGSRDAIVGIRACGICGSDLTYVKIGGIMRQPGGTTPIGHEAAGEVLAVGGEVEGISVGQRVAINPMNTPSFIGSGGPEGAFTETLLVRDAELGHNLLPLADGLPYEVAALTEPLSVALHGVNRAEAKAGDKVVVFGCGPIGLGMVLWLVDRGVSEVVALDPVPERRERARELGAMAVVDPLQEDVRARLEALHGTAPGLVREAVATDAYIDAAGAPNILSDVARMAKPHARLVVTATYMKPIEFDVGAMLTSEMTITTACGYPDEMPEVVAALPRLRDKASSLISHRVPFDRVIEGFDIAATPESAKVMVEF